MNIFKRMSQAMNPKNLDPKRIKLWAFWIVFNVVLFLLPNEMVAGSILCLLPIVGLFIYALVSKEVFEAMVMGCVAMYIMWYKGGFFYAFIDNTFANLTDPDVVMMVSAFLLCGAMINAYTMSGVTKSFSDLLTKKFGNNEKIVLTSAVVISSAMSSDDYVSALISGAAFSPLMDGMKKPRMALSFIIKTCATCVSCLLPFGAWAFFIIMQLGTADSVGDMGAASQIYMGMIPYLFFPIIAVLIVLLFALGVFPRIGKMKEAYTMAENGEQYGSAEGADEDQEALEAMIAADPRKQGVSILNLIIPLVLMAGGLFAFDFNGFMAFGCAIVVTGFLYVFQGIYTISEYIGTLIQGCGNMMDMTIILIFGYAIQGAMSAMGFDAFLLSVCQMVPIAALLPFAFFVYFGLEEYVMTLNYTLFVILMPVLIEILPATGANVPMCLAAVVSAALFGANACVISDLGIIAAKSTRVKIYEQYVACQPYYWIGFVITAVLYLVLGFVL